MSMGFGKKSEEYLKKVRREEEEEIAKRVARENNLPWINLIKTRVERDALALLPEKEAQEAMVAPFQLIDTTLLFATPHPQNPKVWEILNRFKEKDYKVRLFVCSPTSFSRLIKEYSFIPLYVISGEGEIRVSYQKIKELHTTVKNIEDLGRIITSYSKEMISQIIETIIAGALFFDASDIHLEPKEEFVRLRYRFDGILYDICSLKKDIYQFIAARFELVAGLKLNRPHEAQDGRFTIKIEEEDQKTEREIEVRVSTVPSLYGESIVMRILDPRMLLSIEKLGLHPWLFEIITREIKKPNGMLLVTGPTGSGKTTTLYACLQYINSPEVKIITIEDPIEYHIQGLSQTQVEPEKGYDFALGLRAALRQDPDVVLVGEIRDRETAETAVQAALTGHLVFSTLHTNDAAGAIPRLIGMGIDTDVLGPALNLIIAQRLLRKVCSNCVSFERPSDELLFKIQKKLEILPQNIKPDLSNFKLPKVNKCDKCRQTGYKGRLGVYEMFQVNKEVEEAILTSPSIEEMREIGIKVGMIPLEIDGLLRVIEGMTTLDELERVVGKVV